MIRSIACFAVILVTALGWTAVQPARGPLIVVGGGGTPNAVVRRAVELSGGAAAVVAILPHASEREDRGAGSAQMFRDAGVRDAFVLDDLSKRKARTQLERATLVWMPGGSQNRLMDAVRAAELLDDLRAMHARGVAFGGTSAGAAVQSPLMITGQADNESILAEATELVEGLGVWPGVIVDQHAVKRRRFQRLLSAVLDQPKHVGIAIDEQTAVIVQGDAFEVMGASSVLIVDARRANVSDSKAGQPHAATGVALHVLRAGMTFELD